MYRNVNICTESLGSDQTALFRKVSQDVGTISSRRSFSQKHLLPVNRIPNECLILSFQAYNLLTFTSASMTLMTQWSMFFSITVALFYCDFWRSGDMSPYTNYTDQISQDFLTHIFCHFCHGPSILWSPNVSDIPLTSNLRLNRSHEWWLHPASAATLDQILWHHSQTKTPASNLFSAWSL